MNNKPFKFYTHYQTYSVDIHTPVSIFLKLRDLYRDPILLESNDYQSAQNSWSFICLNPIAGIEIKNFKLLEIKYPNQPEKQMPIDWKYFDLNHCINQFMSNFDLKNNSKYKFSAGLYGYFSFDSIYFWEKKLIDDLKCKENPEIPITRFRFYEYIIAINHFNDEMIIFENSIDEHNSKIALLFDKILNQPLKEYKAKIIGKEWSNMTDIEYMNLVKKGVEHCYKGNVFQIVLSREFKNKYYGDEFYFYRNLRRINPSPYLFYFDYGQYKIFGSSPEAQLVVEKSWATLHPIAGTFKRTGDDEHDKIKALELLEDEKELAEHIMLVDLARNDLSVYCEKIEIPKFKNIQFFSHVIHLVSEVKGKLPNNHNSLELFSKTFPAGTLSGAPKFKALALIIENEPSPRGFYSGSIGFIGFNGDMNLAIMIRTAQCKNNTIKYQAGAGVVAKSHPEKELNEVNNKLLALKKAIL